jgi:hypothetical protein
MKVEELYEMLSELIKEGKGHYLVNIECLDGYSEHSNTIHIDDKCQEIEIVGA